MITNIDDNLGRLFQRLESLKLSGDTIVLFMTDNGPQQVRYNSGLRDRKGSVYEGGIRVPFFVRWPGRLQEGLKVDRIAAHIDVAPTLLELCGINRPPGVSFDGASLQPLLLGETENWPDRTLYVQWHRGDEPRTLPLFRRAVAALQTRSAPGRRGACGAAQRGLGALRHCGRSVRAQEHRRRAPRYGQKPAPGVRGVVSRRRALREAMLRPGFIWAPRARIRQSSPARTGAVRAPAGRRRVWGTGKFMLRRRAATRLLSNLLRRELRLVSISPSRA